MGVAHIPVRSPKGNEKNGGVNMAIYHCHVSNVSRGIGSVSTASLAYISGKRIYDQRLDKTFDYARKERIIGTGTLLTDNAPPEFNDPEIMFNSIEKELAKSNARTAKKIEVALPNELDLYQQREIVENFIRENLNKNGYCASYAIHGGKNTHAHILIPNRPIDKKGKWKCQTKSAFVLDDKDNKIPMLAGENDTVKKPILDEDGKQKKDEYGNLLFQKGRSRNGKGTEWLWKREVVEYNQIETKEFLQALRKNWADECNKYLDIDNQIDHRSNKDRNLYQIPTIHEGYAAREFERHGGISERCQYNRDVRLINRLRREINKLTYEIENSEKNETSKYVFQLKSIHQKVCRWLNAAKQDKNISQNKLSFLKKLHHATYQIMEKYPDMKLRITSSSSQKYTPGSGGGGGSSSGSGSGYGANEATNTLFDALLGKSEALPRVEVNLGRDDNNGMKDWTLMSDLEKDEEMIKQWKREF